MSYTHKIIHYGRYKTLMNIRKQCNIPMNLIQQLETKFVENHIKLKTFISDTYKEKDTRVIYRMQMQVLDSYNYISSRYNDTYDTYDRFIESINKDTIINLICKHKQTNSRNRI